MAYVSPLTADNQELRQCLSYFLPIYSYSSAANQRRMQSVRHKQRVSEASAVLTSTVQVALTAYDLVKQVYSELSKEEEMISPYQFGLLLVDWTDPQKLVNA